MNSDFCVAVHAVVFLNHKKTMCSSEQLSENICTHPARIRRILTKLRKNGLLESEDNGSKGGYIFTKDPEACTLADIAKAMEINFIDPAWRSGNSEMDCMIASGMGEIMDQVFAELNEQCYRRLDKITITDVEKRLADKKAKS